MFIVYGAYHFWPKRVAFRDDYCLTCQAPRRSIGLRTFDVGHIFWIPILPAGLWKHWKCTACGRDPHVNPRTRRSLKWAGLIVLIGASVMLWEMPSDTDFGAIGWLLRIAAPSAAILLLMRLLGTLKEPSLRHRLAQVPPAADMVCPFCSTALIAGPRWSCPSCSAERY